MKKNYVEMKNAILKNCGGSKNISNVSHCMTRLRIQLNDKKLFNEKAIKEIQGVLNVVIQNGEYQIVIGQDVPSLYQEFVKEEGIKAVGIVDVENNSNDDPNNNYFERILSFIGGTFSPLIPVLVAGGLTGAVLTLLTNFFGVSTDSGTYVIVYAINQAAFYFLPIFIGFSAANKLKSNGYLGAFLGAILLFSTINNAEGLDFFGYQIAQIAYNSTVFPVLLGVGFMSIVYKILQKYIPIFLKTIFVPLLTILIAVPITLIFLGPIGNTVGTWLADGVLTLYNIAPPIAVMIIGITTPLMVFFGMNNATYPVVFALLAQVGSDPLICTGMAPANVAVGGACLALAIITSNVDEKSISISAGATALCGITEPGVYGVLFPKRYPLIGAMIGGGLGGLIAGLFGMTQYVISTPGFISLPAYMNPDGSMSNLILAIIVMLIAFIVAFLSTYFIGKRNVQQESVDDNQIVSICDGKQINLSKVNDDVFSGETMGSGVAFELHKGKIYSPASGVLNCVFPTGHAFGVTMRNGVELICHIGINTARNSGVGFNILKKQGDIVKAGDCVVEVDLELLKKNYDMTTMLIVTNKKDYDIVFENNDVVANGKPIASCHKN
ncbi:MAG: glucose PTS transporter subunit IIA [Erysipelotrichaceae bacterium]